MLLCSLYNFWIWKALKVLLIGICPSNFGSLKFRDRLREAFQDRFREAFCDPLWELFREPLREIIVLKARTGYMSHFGTHYGSHFGRSQLAGWVEYRNFIFHESLQNFWFFIFKFIMSLRLLSNMHSRVSLLGFPSILTSSFLKSYMSLGAVGKCGWASPFPKPSSVINLYARNEPLHIFTL